jgi:hypothetical protein
LLGSALWNWLWLRPPANKQEMASLLRTAVALAPDDLRQIDIAASKITVQGTPDPENLVQLTGR